MRPLSCPAARCTPSWPAWKVAAGLQSRWEEVDPKREGRPRRRYYQLTPDGAEFARTALARVHTPRTLVNRLIARPTGGAI